MSLQVHRLEAIVENINTAEPHCSCGAVLHGSDLRHYGPHLGGIYLEGFPEPRWVYVTCGRCGYDIAIRKIWRLIQ